MANALISPSYSVGEINYQTMINYKKSLLVAGNAALVGVNVDHAVLLNYASNQVRF